MATQAPLKGVPTANSTLVVILGASQYEDPVFVSSQAFENMSVQIYDYFVSSAGFGLIDPDVQVLNLFGTPLAPHAILNELERFVERRRPHVSDLVIWYVGHGAFDQDQKYCLTLKGSRELHLGASSLRMTDLGNYLRKSASGYRTYLILDACFSGAGPREIMSGRAVLLREVLAADLPQSGVSALCSASAEAVSYFDTATNTTVFSAALLAVLTQGITGGGQAFDLETAFNHTGTQIQSHNELVKRVVPVLHNPRQALGGPVSRVPIFPNRWRPTIIRQNDRRFKAVIFDLDGTLLTGIQYSWTTVWRNLYGPDQAIQKQLRDQYTRGALSYQQWCDACCAHFQEKRLTSTQLREWGRGVSLARNFHATIKQLRAYGITLGIISGGIDIFLESRIRNYKKIFKYNFINKFYFHKKSRELSHIIGTKYDFEGKRDALHKICEEEKITPSEVMFLGDSINDLWIARAAGHSIAFTGSSTALVDVANSNYRENDIRVVLHELRRLDPAFSRDSLRPDRPPSADN